MAVLRGLPGMCLTGEYTERGSQAGQGTPRRAGWARVDPRNNESPDLGIVQPAGARVSVFSKSGTIWATSMSCCFHVFFWGGCPPFPTVFCDGDPLFRDRRFPQRFYALMGLFVECRCTTALVPDDECSIHDVIILYRSAWNSGQGFLTSMM